MIRTIFLIYLLVSLIALVLLKIFIVKLSKNIYSKDIFSLYMTEELAKEAVKEMANPCLKEILKCFIPIYHCYLTVMMILCIIYEKKNPEVIKEISKELKETESLDGKK